MHTYVRAHVYIYLYLFIKVNKFPYKWRVLYLSVWNSKRLCTDEQVGAYMRTLPIVKILRYKIFNKSHRIPPSNELEVNSIVCLSQASNGYVLTKTGGKESRQPTCNNIVLPVTVDVYILYQAVITKAALHSWRILIACTQRSPLLEGVVKLLAISLRNLQDWQNYRANTYYMNHHIVTPTFVFIAVVFKLRV